MDAWVKATQEWLNKTYDGDSRYNHLKTDGITGWSTIYGLRRALQIEEGITSASNNFGPSTYSKCPNINKGDTGRLVYIVQGGLWCKGYNPGGLNGNYGEGTAAAVKQFKIDAGFSNADGNMNRDFMKALLDMSAFTLLAGGSENIRSIQQALNREYYDYFQICPCNGLYDRDMNKMLIYALQKEEGIAKASATGTWGPTTISKCPTLNLYDENNFVKLVRYALVCNGFNISISSKKYDANLDDKAINFAMSLKLDKKQNKIGYPIIKSLMSSNGDPNRTAKGCDTATKLTVDQIRLIKNSGYTHVGRYITNTEGGTLDKKLTRTEYKNIINEGLNVFFIFQESGNKANKFSYDIGYNNGTKALNAALSLGIPKNAVIYFAVDFDALDADISNNIIPYFSGIKNSEFSSYYTIGIYGTRNVCNRVGNTVDISNFFVSDASYGFSGNLGYVMPDGWCYDQFKVDTTLSNSTTSVKIDKDGVSYKDNGVSKMEVSSFDVIKRFLTAFGKSNLLDASIDYESDRIVFLEGPDQAGNYIFLQIEHNVSYETATNGTIEFIDGEISGTTLNDLEASLSVGDDVKMQIRATIKEFGASVDYGRLHIYTGTVSDQYAPGIIFIYTITAPVISESGLNSYVKLRLIVKRAINIQAQFAYETLNAADQALCRQVMTVGLVVGMGVTGGAIIGILSSYGVIGTGTAALADLLVLLINGG